MTWRAHLESWPLGEVRGYTTEELAGAPLPSELREYYAVAGRLSTWNLHLVPPDDLAVGEDGRMAFIHEEQGVYSFETLPIGDDPPVWLREDGHEAKLDEPLSKFLLQYVIFEGTAHGVGGWGYINRDDLRTLLTALPPLPLGPWPHPSGATLTFHGTEEIVGLFFEYSRETPVEVHVAARDSDVLARLPAVIDWDGDPPA